MEVTLGVGLDSVTRQPGRLIRFNIPNATSESSSLKASNVRMAMCMAGAFRAAREEVGLMDPTAQTHDKDEQARCGKQSTDELENEDPACGPGLEYRFRRILGVVEDLDGGAVGIAGDDTFGMRRR